MVSNTIISQFNAFERQYKLVRLVQSWLYLSLVMSPWATLFNLSEPGFLIWETMDANAYFLELNEH